MFTGITHKHCQKKKEKKQATESHAALSLWISKAAILNLRTLLNLNGMPTWN